MGSDVYDYSDAGVVVKGRITVTGNNANRIKKKLTFKNNAPFTSCISKINNTLVENAEDVAIVMPMYNLLEYSTNYSMKLTILWNYYRNEINDDENENDDNDKRFKNNKIIISKYFKYKKIIGSMPNNTNILVVVSLKCFSNFRRSLNLPLINCEIELDLKWEHYWVILEISRTFRAVDPNVNLVEHNFLTSATSATFKINKAKLYVPVLTFFINDNIKFLENIKQGFKRRIWNNYRPERITQPRQFRWSNWSNI